MTQSDYHARNAIGTVVRSFNDPEVAKEWAERNAPLHNGLHVVQIKTTVSQRLIYTPGA